MKAVIEKENRARVREPAIGGDRESKYEDQLGASFSALSFAPNSAQNVDKESSRRALCDRQAAYRLERRSIGGVLEARARPTYQSSGHFA